MTETLVTCEGAAVFRGSDGYWLGDVESGPGTG